MNMVNAPNKAPNKAPNRKPVKKQMKEVNSTLGGLGASWIPMHIAVITVITAIRLHSIGCHLAI